MQCDVLGPIRVIDDGAVLAIGSERQRRLLGVLVLRAGTSVSSDVLCEHLGVSPGALRVAVSRLRAVVGADAIVTTPTGYELRAERIDVGRFEELLERARHEPSQARQALTDALALWRGAPYGPFGDEPWAQPEVVRLDELHAGAVEDLVACLIDECEWTRAIATIGHLIEQHPYRDRPRALLMQALADSGRRRDALRAFQDYQELLGETFGTLPSESIVALDRAIARQGEPPDPSGSLDEPSGRFPAPSTSFVGRDRDVRELVDAVGQSRLVTLTGTGGIGKTRLAIEVVGEIRAAFAEDYPDGLAFVDLVPVGAADSLGGAVASALGITLQMGPSVADALASAIAVRRALIVFDNCEHVLDAAAELVATIVARAPSVTIIATSREALGVPVERVWAVPPLGLEGEGASPAVELFVERARAVRPGFSGVEPAEAEAVAEICGRLDGLPLAIELAAARMASMRTTDLCERLAERFRVLAAPNRGPERHQTMRRTVAWSFDLLDLTERLVLLRAAVFAGGFDLASGAAVCAVDGVDEAALLDVLDSLVRKSLVVVSRRSDGGVRYSMEETIREFALDELAASGAGRDVRARHARFFADAAVDHFAIWDGPRQRLALDWVDAEFANLRAAFRWAVSSGDVATAAAVSAHVALMAMPLQRYEASGWAEELLDAARVVSDVWLPRLLVGASFCVFAGRVGDSISYAQEAQKLEDDQRFDAFDAGWAAMCEANAWRYAGDADRFVEILTGLVGQPGVADVIGRSGVLVGLPAVGRADDAAATAVDAITAADQYGNPFWIAYTRYGHGRLLIPSDPDRAASVLRDGLAYAADQRLTYFEAIIAREAATIQVTTGSLADQLSLLDAAIERFQHAGADATLSQSLAYLALLFGRLGRPEEAATLFGVSHENALIHTVIGLDEAVADLRMALGAAAFEEHLAAGEAMELVDAVAYARDRIRDAVDTLA